MILFIIIIALFKTEILPSDSAEDASWIVTSNECLCDLVQNS